MSLGQKDGIWIIGCDEDITLESKAVIYATGCKNRPLGVPGEENIMAEDCHFVLYVMVLSIKERELQ